MFNGQIRIRRSHVRDAIIPIGNLYPEFRGHADIPFPRAAPEEPNNGCLPIRTVPFALGPFFRHPVDTLGIRIIYELCSLTPRGTCVVCALVAMNQPPSSRPVLP